MSESAAMEFDTSIQTPGTRIERGGKWSRRAIGSLASFLLIVPTLALAQSDYPNRPIRLVVGYPPGGTTDVIARVTGEALSRTIGQPVIVENKPGAGGTIASDFVSRAAPDGYTLLVNSVFMFGADQLTFKDTKYDGYRDFTSIGLLADAPLIVTVSANLGVTTMQELIAKAKESPNKFFFGSAGSGTATHLAGLYFKRLTGTQIVHVPFKGGSPSAASLLSNDTQVLFATPVSVVPLIQSGRLKALAVTQNPRSPLYPNIPSAAEVGLPSFEFSVWLGAFGPAKLPPAVLDKLSKAISIAVADPVVQKTLASNGVQAVSSKSPKEFMERIAKDGPEFTRLTQEAGLQAD